MIGHFIERYQLPDFFRETLYQQTPNIQKEFVDSYAARGFPETTDEQFKHQLEYKHYQLISQNQEEITNQ